jgi:hypothetical protein
MGGAWRFSVSGEHGVSGAPTTVHFVDRCIREIVMPRESGASSKHKLAIAITGSSAFADDDAAPRRD